MKKNKGLFESFLLEEQKSRPRGGRGGGESSRLSCAHRQYNNAFLLISFGKARGGREEKKASLSKKTQHNLEKHNRGKKGRKRKHTHTHTKKKESLMVLFPDKTDSMVFLSFFPLFSPLLQRRNRNLCLHEGTERKFVVQNNLLKRRGEERVGR